MAEPLPPGGGEFADQVRDLPELVTGSLDALEERTRTDITTTLDQAVAAQGLNGGALRAAVDRLVEIITSAAHRAVNIGAAIARALTPPRWLARDPDEVVADFTMLGGRTTLLPARRRTTLPDQATVARAVAEFQIASDVDQALRQAAERMDATPPPQRPERLEQTKRSVWTHGLTTIHQASNRGATWFAERFGLGLRWYTRRDNRVCWACGPMHGRTVASADQSFVLPPGPRWRGYTGKPPAHPRCRCSVRPVRFRA